MPLPRASRSVPATRLKFSKIARSMTDRYMKGRVMSPAFVVSVRWQTRNGKSQMEKGGDGICTFSKYDILSIVNSK